MKIIFRDNLSDKNFKKKFRNISFTYLSNILNKYQIRLCQDQDIIRNVVNLLHY